VHRLEGELAADRPTQMVSAAASLLSQLTQFAGVVMTPKRREAAFRHLEFLRLSDRRVLLIIVTPEGDVQNRILHTEHALHAVAADRGVELLQPELRRAAVRHDPRAPRRRAARAARGHRGLMTPRSTQARRARAGRGARRHRRAEPAQREDLSSNMERLRRLFDLFEQKTALLHCWICRSARTACRSTSAANPGSCRSTNAAS
jgi:heat-inducible transcriptional repressor